MPKPEVSVILGTYNRFPFLRAAVESVRKNGIVVPYEIIVVDGGSTDGTLKWLAQQEDIITIVQHNRGKLQGMPIARRSWGYHMNLAFKCAQGTYLLMISDDTLLVPTSVMRGIQRAEALLAAGHNIGAVAFYWRNWPEQIEYHVGLTLSKKLYVNHGLFLRRAVEQVAWIDEDTYQFYYADCDLCLKLWFEGYEIVDCPDAFVEHFPHAGRIPRHSEVDRAKFIARWSGTFNEPEQPYPGGRILKKYDDPHNTAQAFPQYIVSREGLKQRLKQAMRALTARYPNLKLRRNRN